MIEAVRKGQLRIENNKQLKDLMDNYDIQVPKYNKKTMRKDQEMPKKVSNISLAFVQNFLLSKQQLKDDISKNSVLGAFYNTDSYRRTKSVNVQEGEKEANKRFKGLKSAEAQEQ